MDEEQDIESIPLRSATDSEILMHREVHFGGNFMVMLEYYEKEGKGSCQEIEIEQIRNLAEIEERTQKNLAPLLLSGAEAEKVARAKEAYKKLRDLYEEESQPDKYLLLIADLILSEEQDPKKEIAAITKEKSAIVSFLLELLHAESFYDPLFPGYGQGPLLAAKCLGIIGDKRAIISLFETIGQGDFFHEDVLLDALKAIGQPAKDFLLKVVQARPLNSDNECAAIALIHFKNDPEVAEICLRLLLEPEVRAQSPLSSYLALACEGLAEPQQQSQFRDLSDDPATPSVLALDIKAAAKSWK